MRIPVSVSRWCAAIGVAGVLVACTSPSVTPGPIDSSLSIRPTSSIDVWPTTVAATATSTAVGTHGPSGFTRTSATSPAPSLPGTTAPTVPTGKSGSTSVAVAPGGALRALAELPVKGRAPKTGYKRARFGESWTDDVSVDGGHNGCDTRNDILRRDLTAIALKPGSHGCAVATGILRDPYSGQAIDFVRGVKTSALVQIDHVVALSDAWQKGAQALSAAQRQNLAGDPLELLAVDGPTNESKGDGDAATWLPPAKSFRCTYVARQIAIKAKYSLWVTAAERTAMADVLAGCPSQDLPTAATTDIPAIATN